MRVPLLDLQSQYRPLRDQIRAEFDEIADAQAFVLGPKVAQLESSIARRLGLTDPCVIGASSGTDAQLMLMMGLGIGPGDAVILPSYTFFATAGCVSRLGAAPVFVDIDPLTYNLCLSSLEKALDSHRNVKAILVVHLYGCCADTAGVRALAQSRGIPVLEDAAQALGAEHPDGPAGALANGAWFSFYPTKNLGAFGDAGMTVCPDPDLASRVRALRNHGMEVRYYHKWVGGNFRLDAIQAAVLNVKLPHLDRWSQARREHAARYREEFRKAGLGERLTLPVEPWLDSGRTNHHIYHQFVIRAPKRDALRAFLAERGVGTEVYYPLPLHRQECFANLGYREGDLPHSERAAKETLALPIYPELSPEQITYVVETIAAFYG